MLLRRVSSLAILMLALSGTAAIAAPEALPYNQFDRVIAQGPGPGGGERGPEDRQGKGGDRWIDQLNLSADQQQEIKQIRETSQSEFEQLHEDMREAQEQMHQLMSSNASDSQLRDRHSQMQELHQRMGDLQFEQMLKIRGVLTEAQRQELAESMQQRREDGGRGGRPGRSQGRGQSQNNQ